MDLLYLWSSASRRRNLKHRYNLTIEQFSYMLHTQLYRCKICKEPFVNIKSKHVHVDHDHETGKVRGLLCNHCNRLLGACKDDTTILDSAIDYLASQEASLLEEYKEG